jgi:hypothetical protein
VLTFEMGIYGVPTKKGVLPWLVGWACCTDAGNGTRDFCPVLSALVLAHYKMYLFLARP